VDPSRWRIRGLLVVLVLSIHLVSASQEPAKLDSLDAILPVLAELREDVWTTDNAVRAIEALVSADELAAAGWWLEESRNALERNQLPRAARKPLRACEKSLQARMRARYPEAAKLGVRFAQHAGAVANRTNYREADRAATSALRLLRFFPNPAARRTLDGVLKRIARGEKRDHHVRSIAGQRRKTNELIAAADQAILSRRDAITVSYERFGTLRAYPCVRDLAVRDVTGPKRRKLLERIRKAALGQRQPEILKLIVVANRPIDIFVEGKKVGSQKGAYPLGPLETRGWQPFRIPVVPGDRIVITVHQRRGTRPETLACNRHIFLHAELGDHSLTKSDIAAFRPPHPDEVDTTDLLPVDIGTRLVAPPEMRDIVPEAHLTDVAFSFGVREEGTMAIVPVVKAQVDWFKKMAVPLEGYRAPDDAAYLIRIPLLDQPCG